jgi:hypothetical protein
MRRGVFDHLSLCSAAIAGWRSAWSRTSFGEVEDRALVFQSPRSKKGSPMEKVRSAGTYLDENYLVVF